MEDEAVEEFDKMVGGIDGVFVVKQSEEMSLKRFMRKVERTSRQLQIDGLVKRVLGMNRTETEVMSLWPTVDGVFLFEAIYDVSFAFNGLGDGL